MRSEEIGKSEVRDLKSEIKELSLQERNRQGRKSVNGNGMSIFFARTAADCIVGVDEHGA
jgi:hypothetical protein